MKLLTRIKHIFLTQLHKPDKSYKASGTLEMVLIIVIILGLLVIFRDNIEQLIKAVFSKINSQVNSF